MESHKRALTARIALRTSVRVAYLRLLGKENAMLKFSTSALIAFTLLSAPALAAQPVAPSLAGLRTFTVDDLQAALADANAQTPPDTRHAQCWQAAIAFVQNFKPEEDLPQKLGLAQLIQKTFTLKAGAQSQLPDALIQACSLTISDLNLTFAQFAGMIGVRAVALPKLPF
jgi:hypothetical protein